MDDMLAELEGHIQKALSALQDFEGEQDDSSDEGNPETIERVRQLLDDALAHADDLVP